MKLATNIKNTSLAPIHPALDFVDDVAYVTVLVADADDNILPVVITSTGQIFKADEWYLEVRRLGLNPRVKEIGIEEARWNQESVQKFIDGELEAPTWEEAYNTIYNLFKERLVVPDQRYITIAVLFAMMTYFHPLFDVIPILHLLGEAESGKSKIAIFISKVAFNGIAEGNPSSSSLFRSAHIGRYTQVITEADHLARLDSGDSFVRWLQAGTTEAEATVRLSEAGTNKAFKPEKFYIFNPRVLVSTKEFSSHPLRSRSIRLDIHKTPNANQKKLRRSYKENETWVEARDKMYRLLLLKWKEVRDTQEKLRDEWNGPTGRVFDKFLPLATIAKLVSEEVFNIVHEFAMEGVEEARRDKSTTFDGILYQFARYLVKDGDKRLTEKQIYEIFLKGYAPDNTPEWMLAERVIPDWAKELGLTLNVAKLKKWVPNSEMLAENLKRKDLIPRKKDQKRNNRGNPYNISKENIDSLAAIHLNPIEEGEIEEEQEEKRPWEDLNSEEDEISDHDWLEEDPLDTPSTSTAYSKYRFCFTCIEMVIPTNNDECPQCLKPIKYTF